MDYQLLFATVFATSLCHALPFYHSLTHAEDAPEGSVQTAAMTVLNAGLPMGFPTL